MDVSTLTSLKLREYARYLDDTEYGWLGWYPPPTLSPKEWAEREDPTDPDLDA